MTNGHRPTGKNGTSPKAADVAGDSQDSFGTVYARLAGAVAVAGARRADADADPWIEGPDHDEIEREEPEKELTALEEQENADDPVRMYLREIGRVYLLSGDDEKRL